jgi:hypothetical protein
VNLRLMDRPGSMQPGNNGVQSEPDRILAGHLNSPAGLDNRRMAEGVGANNPGARGA